MDTAMLTCMAIRGEGRNGGRGFGSVHLFEFQRFCLASIPLSRSPSVLDDCMP